MNAGNENRHNKTWMRGTLLAAGVYNVAWGALVILFPNALFQLTGMDLPRYPQIWQCVGMIVGVYGVGYLIASTNPIRHWPITLVGLLGKIFGPLGFSYAVITGSLPLAFGMTILTNDLIWWIPFTAILYAAFRAYNAPAVDAGEDIHSLIRSAHSHRGATLKDLSWERPTMVVFLRHFGCTFCREALADLAALREELRKRDVGLAIVHMGKPLEATQLASKYHLESVHRFCDPQSKLYRAFQLDRGRLWQLFSPRVWLRGMVVALMHGHGIGRIAGDGFQMPGVFLLDRGRIVSSFRAEYASDRPDYLEIACPSDTKRQHEFSNDTIGASTA